MNKTKTKTRELSNEKIQTDKKKYKMKESWLQLAKYSKSFFPILIISVIALIGSAVFTIITPNILSDLTNEIQKAIYMPIDLDAVLKFVFTLLIMYVFSTVLMFVGDIIFSIYSQRVAQKLCSEMGNKINRLPLAYFDKHGIGDTLSRVTNDVDMICQTLNQSLGSLITAFATLIGSTIMMFVTNWILALVAIGASLIGFFIMAIVVSRSQKFFTAQQEYLGKLNSHIEENYTNHNIVKAYNAEEERAEEFNSINNKLYNCAWKSQFLSGLMMPILNFIGNFGYVAVCVVGAVLTFNGTIDFGVVIAFIVYVRLFSQPLSQVAQSITSLQQTTASNYRVFDFLNEIELENEKSKTLTLDNVKGDICLQNIKFGYDKNKTIIKDFSINIKAGQKVAIVGPTGAGKTTIVNLLMRFYEIDDGQIKVDGVNLKDIKREIVHSLFGMVLQDTWLFNGTIMENIKFNNKEINDEIVINACKEVGIHHFIMTLPDGYNTVINEQVNISQGQRQLLTIARAMVQNSPMLILDEATSSVDTRTELQIQKAMDKLMHGKTSIIIAHRLSTIKNADQILVMKDGDIIETGSHNTLLEQNGFYANLYNSQFSEEE